MILVNQKMRDYAKVIVKVGANVQPKQRVIIDAIVDAVPLVNLVVEECYRAGASHVEVRYDDIRYKRLQYQNEALDVLTDLPDYFVKYRSEDVLKKGACRIAIRGSDPNGFKGIDPKKIMQIQRALSTKLKPLSEWTMKSKCQWTIACWPSVEWAQLVFPKLTPEKAVDALWEAILKTVRVDGKSNPIAAWKQHNDLVETYATKLNKYNFDYIECKNKLGTNIKIKLVKNHIWLSGRERGLHNQWHAAFTANLPTEETWTMPDRLGLNGKVYASKPLNVNGNIIDQFWFEFKNGKVVKFDAKKGKETLAQLLKTDAGASYTGEIALVPITSPIHQSGILFYSTLYDENAACHIALGASYPNNLKNGTNLTRQQLTKLGSNDSIIHCDFMFGTEDLVIHGYQGKKPPVQIFKNGKFTI